MSNLSSYRDCPKRNCKGKTWNTKNYNVFSSLLPLPQITWILLSAFVVCSLNLIKLGTLRITYELVRFVISIFSSKFIHFLKRNKYWLFRYLFDEIINLFHFVCLLWVCNEFIVFVVNTLTISMFWSWLSHAKSLKQLYQRHHGFMLLLLSIPLLMNECLTTTWHWS